MTAALLSIGTELTRGEIVNTNAAWLAAELTAAGFAVGSIESIPDDMDRMVATIQQLAQRRVEYLLELAGFHRGQFQEHGDVLLQENGRHCARGKRRASALRTRDGARGHPLPPRPLLLLSAGHCLGAGGFQLRRRGSGEGGRGGLARRRHGGT